MSSEPDSVMLQLLRQMRAEIGDMRSDLKNDIADARSEVHSLAANVASDMLTMRKETSDQVAGLRRAVVEYHTSVIGHGIIISELEARVRRVEQHLDLPAFNPQ